MIYNILDFWTLIDGSWFSIHCFFSISHITSERKVKMMACISRIFSNWSIVPVSNVLKWPAFTIFFFKWNVRSQNSIPESHTNKIKIVYRWRVMDLHSKISFRIIYKCVKKWICRFKSRIRLNQEYFAKAFQLTQILKSLELYIFARFFVLCHFKSIWIVENNIGSNYFGYAMVKNISKI